MDLSIRYCLVLVGITTVIAACTPKVTQETQSSETEKPQGKPTVSEDPCAKFADSYAGESALDAHVIYRDFMRNEKYPQAMPYWRKAFSLAPAADGKRQTHFEDGITIYNHLLEQQETDAGKRVYLDSIFYMYDRMGQCYYPEGGYIAGRKGFDLYYKYKDVVDNQEIFTYFSKSIDMDELETHAFVINPFTALLVEMYTQEQITQEVAVKYARKILEITERHVDDDEDGWPVVLTYAPARMDVFETVKGFFDCQYYIEKYYASVNLDSLDCEDLFLLRTRLNWGECEKEGAQFQAVEAEYAQRCLVTEAPGLLSQARDNLEVGKYQAAIDNYAEYLSDQTDPERLAKYNLRISKIYYGHLKNFQRARQYAYKALEHRPDWGEPYILIGKLYASSGPLCGPGRGWDSQIVTWPAIDKFIQAKSVDPSVASEANKWINYYSRYMPSIEDIFQRQLTEGQSFTVGCWIQETTRIRAAPRS